MPELLGRTAMGHRAATRAQGINTAAEGGGVRDIKPIETHYKGYKFRSRLEARWAVFFDALGWPWEYEKEGYDLGAGVWYLPDFWLPQVQMWAEVKPAFFTDEEREKCRKLAIGTGYPCLLLDGIPAFKPYWAMEPCTDSDQGPSECDYGLSNYHNYPHDERRFFASLGLRSDASDFEKCYGDDFSDMKPAIEAARQARFEQQGR